MPILPFGGEMTELKRCPACDSNHIMFEEDFLNTGINVICQDCGESSDKAGSIKSAAEAWNTRKGKK